MRKLFKKSLACCLVLALSLCMFAGAISANALTTNPAYSTEDVTVAPGESTTIKFTIKDFAEIQGVILKVYVPSVVASIDAVTVDGIELVEWSDEKGEGNYQIDSDATGKFVKFMTLANFEGVDNVAALTFDIKVTVDAEAEAGEYGYTAPVIQATDGDVLVTINGEFGLFTVVEKEPEVPVCEHDWKVASAAPGTAADAPGYLNFVCSKCGEEDNNEVTYHGQFRCSTYMELESEIMLKFGNAHDRFNSIPAGAETGAEKGLMIVTDDQGEFIDIMDLFEDREDLNSVYYYSIPVAPYNLGETYGGTTYVYCDGAWYSGKTNSISFVQMLTAGIDNAKTTAAKKTLYVDLLNFGAAVQTRYNVNNEVLVNSTLTEAQAAYGTTEKPEFPAYTFPVVDQTTDIFEVNWAFESESRIVLKHTFAAKNYKNRKDISTLHPVISYTDAWGVAHTGDGAYTYSFNGDQENNVLNYDEKVFNRFETKNNQYQLAFRDFTACDLRNPVTIDYYDDEGNKVESSVTASLENIIAAAYPTATAAQKALYDALFIYCDSARAAFNVTN